MREPQVAVVERDGERVGRRPEAARGRDEREVDQLGAGERRAVVARAISARVPELSFVARQRGGRSGGWS